MVYLKYRYHQLKIPFPQKKQDIISTAQLPVSSVRDAVILLQQPGSGAGRTLDVEELREIVAELIAAYSEPDLQRSLERSWWMIRGWDDRWWEDDMGLEDGKSM